MAHAGWNAKGLLRPLWNQYAGGRDGLANAVGTQGTVLSSINSGKRNLGHGLAARLAQEAGVTLAELGAPLELADEAGRNLHDRLAKLEDDVGALLEGQKKALAGQDGLVEMLASCREILDALQLAPRQTHQQS